jgi:hypothetical protein
MLAMPGSMHERARPVGDFGNLSSGSPTTGKRKLLTAAFKGEGVSRVDKRTA